MRRLMIFAVTGLLTAQDTSLSDGQFWTSLAPLAQVTYALGWKHGFDSASGANPLVFTGDPVDLAKIQKIERDLNRCTNQMTSSQVRAIVDKYVQGHPESWHGRLGVLTFDALMSACGVRRTE